MSTVPFLANVCRIFSSASNISENKVRECSCHCEKKNGIDITRSTILYNCPFLRLGCSSPHSAVPAHPRHVRRGGGAAGVGPRLGGRRGPDAAPGRCGRGDKDHRGRRGGGGRGVLHRLRGDLGLGLCAGADGREGQRGAGQGDGGEGERGRGRRGGRLQAPPAASTAAAAGWVRRTWVVPRAYFSSSSLFFSVLSLSPSLSLLLLRSLRYCHMSKKSIQQGFPSILLEWSMAVRVRGRIQFTRGIFLLYSLDLNSCGVD